MISFLVEGKYSCATFIKGRFQVKVSKAKKIGRCIMHKLMTANHFF
jgi:hypothetical protein